MGEYIKQIFNVDATLNTSQNHNWINFPKIEICKFDETLNTYQVTYLEESSCQIGRGCN